MDTYFSSSRFTLLSALAGFSFITIYGYIKRTVENSSGQSTLLFVADALERTSDDFRAASLFFSLNSESFTPHEKQRLYGLYKQSLHGDMLANERVDGSEETGNRRLKSEAWKKLEGVSPADAQEMYIRLVEARFPFWRSDKEAESVVWAVGSVPQHAIGEGQVDDTAIGKFCELCARGDISQVEESIGSNPLLVKFSDRDGMTGLHWASDRGHEDVAKLLISRGCELNKQDDSGNTALHIAVMAGQKEMIRLLLDAKADSTMVNADGDTAGLLIPMIEAGIQVISRSVVPGGEALNQLVAKLTSLCGQGTEIDVFEETLVFHPLQEAGNMNYVNREVTVTLQYKCTANATITTVTHIGSAVPFESFSAFNTRTTPSSNANIRRTFLKAGFIARNDFSKKGLEFSTRTGVEVTLSRPYNASLSESQTYAEGIPTWETLHGPLPLESDYLLELKQLVKSQIDLESTAANITNLLLEIKR